MLKGDVLFVSGSLRRGSYNTALLREASALPSGVGHEWLDGIAALVDARPGREPELAGGGRAYWSWFPGAT